MKSLKMLVVLTILAIELESFAQQRLGIVAFEIYKPLRTNNIGDTATARAAGVARKNGFAVLDSLSPPNFGLDSSTLSGENLSSSRAKFESEIEHREDFRQSQNLVILAQLEKQIESQKVEKFHQYFRGRLNDIRFYRVDFKDLQTLNEIDENDQDDFNRMFFRGFVRASESLVVPLIDSKATKYSDLIPDEIVNLFKTSKTSVRLGYTRFESAEVSQLRNSAQVPTLENVPDQNVAWSSVDGNFEEQVMASMSELPRAEARTELFRDLLPGEASMFGRFKTDFCGWGVDWKPAPDDLPVSIRIFKSHEYDGDSRNCELSMNWNLLAFRNSESPGDYSLVLNAKYDTESDEVFVGVFFSNR